MKNLTRLRPCHRMKSLSIIGGFLDGQVVELANGLNCIIGARGTGKTTVLEFVRYTLGEKLSDNAASVRIDPDQYAAPPRGCDCSLVSSANGRLVGCRQSDTTHSNLQAGRLERLGIVVSCAVVSDR